MEHLYTPWRMAYITGNTKPADGSCIFCNKRDSNTDSADLIVARSDYIYVILNRYPYSNGHVMVVPYDHVSSQEDLPVEALTDLAVTTNKILAALRKVYHPAAFNLGANIGAAAGAGIAAHYHFHIVPRWNGDSNFMTVISDTRVIPDTLENTLTALTAAWHELYEQE
jgi:ATP adenylyltransferase